MPSSTIRPSPIRPTTRSPTVTWARLTLLNNRTHANVLIAGPIGAAKAPRTGGGWRPTLQSAYYSDVAMIPILLRLGPITIYSYGLMMALGFIAADIACTSEFKRHGFKGEWASTLILWTAISGVAGSRVYDIIDNWPRYAANPWNMLFSGAGFVWYGGLAGGIIASYFVARYYRIRWLVLCDMAVPGLAIGHAIGRIGCQLSGDGDWGMVSNLPWAMAYPKAIVGWNGRSVLALSSSNQLVAAPGCNDVG